MKQATQNATAGANTCGGESNARDLIELLPELLTDKQVGRVCGLASRTIHRFADSGRMPPGFKIGGARRWSKAAILDWIANGCRPVRKAGR